MQVITHLDCVHSLCSGYSCPSPESCSTLQCTNRKASCRLLQSGAALLQHWSVQFSSMDWPVCSCNQPASQASEHLPSAAGAGDQFAAGFLYGIMRGYSMRKCAQLGCLAGGAVVQVVGAEMTPNSWRWVFARSAPTDSPACLTFSQPCIFLLGSRARMSVY